MRFTFIIALKRLCLFSLIVLSCSCSPKKQWQLQDVAGHLPDLRFSLTDDTGKPVTAQNYRGKIVLLYFGFTGCGTQCPIVMQRLAGVLAQLGHDADQMRVLLVTVDPVHDTPQAMHNYVSNFDKTHIAGLTGNDAGIRDIARRYRAAYRSNSLVHSNAVYIFDATGKAKLLASDDDNSDAFVHDLRQLIRS
jgi:protein SCO1/2